MVVYKGRRGCGRSGRPVAAAVKPRNDSNESAAQRSEAKRNDDNENNDNHEGEGKKRLLSKSHKKCVGVNLID